MSNLLIESKNRQIKTAPVVQVEFYKPKGLSQGLWWGITPWKEEKGRTLQSYQAQVGTAGMIGGIALSVGMVAAPAVGLMALNAIPVVGTGLFIAGSAALGGYMSYQTAREWKGMSNAQRGFQGAMIALCFVPAIGAAGRVMSKAAIGEYRVAGNNLIKAENIATKDMVKSLKVSYGKGVANAYKSMSKTQTKLLDTYIKIETLTQEKGILAKLQKSVKSTDASLSKLRAKATTLEIELKMKATDFQTKMGRKLGFDNPRLPENEILGEFESAKRIYQELPHDIVMNTRAAAESIVGKNDIKSLKLAADKAATRLREAQGKHPTDASKWSDLAYDAAVKQTQYELAKLGSPMKVLNELTQVRELIKKGGLTREAMKVLKTREQELADTYAKLMKDSSMETVIKAKTFTDERGNLQFVRDADGNIVYEVPKAISVGRGGVATETKIKPGTRITGGGTTVKAKPSIRTSIVAAIGVSATTLKPYTGKGAEMPVITPATIEKLTTIVNNVVEAIPVNVVDSELVNAVQNDISNQPAIQNLAKTQIQALTKIAVDTIRANPARGKGNVVFPIFTSEKTIYLTKKQLEGSWGWRQGFLFKLWYPPFSQKTLISVIRKPPFVQIFTGKGSPQKSLAGAGIRSTQTARMGIARVKIIKPRKGRARLVFTRASEKTVSVGK